MAVTYFVINEQLTTSSGIDVTGAHVDMDFHVGKLASQGTVSIDIPAWADTQAISDNAEPIYFRKKGTLDKVGGVSSYALTAEQIAKMNFLNGDYKDVAKDILSDVLGIDKLKISDVEI